MSRALLEGIVQIDRDPFGNICVLCIPCIWLVWSGPIIFGNPRFICWILRYLLSFTLESLAIGRKKPSCFASWTEVLNYPPSRHKGGVRIHMRFNYWLELEIAMGCRKINWTIGDAQVLSYCWLWTDEFKTRLTPRLSGVLQRWPHWGSSIWGIFCKMGGLTTTVDWLEIWLSWVTGLLAAISGSVFSILIQCVLVPPQREETQGATAGGWGVLIFGACRMNP